jgi:hypothetical protein
LGKFTEDWFMATLSQQPARKHHGFIRDRLDATLRRIRLLDGLTAAFGLIALVLSYLVAMIVLDLLFRLADGTRQVLMVFFLVGVGGYVWYFLVRPWRREINPHYAARRLEASAGEGPHHVVNWIDLENEHLAGVFRHSLDRRTAKELDQADPETAISNRPTVVTASLAGGLFVGVVGLFLVLGPGPFAAFFSRALGRAVEVPARTQVEMVRPALGDAVVTIGNPVALVVKISGNIPQANTPEAPTLHFWTATEQTPRTRPLSISGSNEWAVTLGPLEVGNGFFYRITAGDGRTPDYQIRVRASASLTDFRATYRYRPYLQLPDRVRTVRQIEEIRGTEVFLEAKPNREVREALLEFTDAAGAVRLLPGDITPQGLRFRFVLDQPGTYRLTYTASTGENYRDVTAHEVAIVPDAVPRITWLAPAKDVQIPLNGSLPLSAQIEDDIGLASVTLKLRVVDGPDLPDLPYLANKLGTPQFGTPRQLAYLELAQPEQWGQAVRPGSTIEYWLEARDACDVPTANVGVSDRYRIQIAPAGDAAAQQQKRDEQEKQKNEHDKMQEEGLKQEKQERDRQNKPDSGEGTTPDAKPDPNTPPDPNAAGQDPDEADLERQADALRDALNKKEQGGEGKNDDKPGEAKPGEGKPADQPGAAPPQPGEGKGNDQDKPGEAKGGQGEQPGESKGGEKAEQGAQGKDQGKDDGSQGKPSEAKPGDPGQQEGEPKPGEAKGGEPKPGEGKGPGNERAADKPGESRPGEPMPSEAAPGEGKDGKPNDAARPDDNAGAGKPGEQPAPDAKAQGKADGPPPPDAADGKPSDGPPPPEAKPGAGKDGKAGDGKPGEGKPGDPPPSGATDNGSDAGTSKGDTSPPMPGEAGAGKAGMPPPAGMGGMGEAKPGAEAGATGEASDKPADAMGTAPGGEGGKPGEAKAASGSGRGENDGAEPPPAQRERPEDSRATLLQLEDFRRSVGDDILKDAQMSREQFDRFLRDYARLAERRKQREEERDNIRPGAPGGLPSTGGITPGTPQTPDTLQGTGRPKPPPEYRDAYADFLRRLR